MADKDHVDFDQVKAIVVLGVERGIAAAEVIHPNFKAVGAQLIDLLFQAASVVWQVPLRNFNLDQRPGETCSGNQ